MNLPWSSTATVKPQSARLAGVPPATLGFAVAAPAAAGEAQSQAAARSRGIRALVKAVAKVAVEVGGDRLAHPALGVRIGHPVAPEQHLLILQRQPRDLPAHREALEQHLLPARPNVLARDRGACRPI